MPLHPPSAPNDAKPSASVPTQQTNSRQKRHEPEFFVWLGKYWERITEGLEMGQLWKQFKADTQSSFRFYQRDFDARSPHEGRRHDVLHTIQEFTWAILEKLSPARRVLLLLSILILMFGSLDFHY